MIYRLAFRKTTDGYLKLTTSAKRTPALVAIHLNPQVLASAARIAGISADDIQELSSTALKVWIEEGLDVCCEAVELNSEQTQRDLFEVVFAMYA